MAKNKSRNSAPVKKYMIAGLLKKAGIFLTAAIVMFFIFRGVKVFFLKYHYFNIKDIDIAASQGTFALSPSELLVSLKGKNIFAVDIKAVSRAIHADYPELKRVIVKRVLPQSIRIEVIPRKAFAFIKASGYFPIDDDAVALSRRTDLSADLPVIEGISSWERPRAGEILRSKRIGLAVNLIKLANETNVFKDNKLKTVDTSNVRNILLYLDSGLQIRIGKDDFKKRLDKLLTIFKDPEIDPGNLEYIDLRFKDVVLGPK